MEHSFGNINAWTKDKLERITKYLSAYTTALKNKNFRLAYIDAFAGTGFINIPKNQHSRNLFPDDSEMNLKEVIDGSARIALQIEPSFQKYIFIENNRSRFSALQEIKQEFSNLSDRIEIVNAEANSYVQTLCEKDWIKNRNRAVMFLDPYGMQVSWKTIEAIANTKAIDLWILFPIGAVNRLLNKNGKIREGRKKALNNLFGGEEWFEQFFYEEERTNLISQEKESFFVKKASFENIAKYFNDRLKTIFADVAPNPLFLNNSTNSPIFLLCFAVGNPTGAPIAVRIAQNILKQR